MKQIKLITVVAGALNEIADNFSQSSVIFLTTTTDADGRTIVLAGNARGLIYLASLLLTLVENERPGQHFHLDKNTVLTNPAHNLIIMLQNQPSNN